MIVPEGSVQEKQLTGQALADATVNIIDPATGDIIATTTTDANGYYQVFVPAGGPYLLQVVKDGLVVLQITPQVEVGIEYDLGTADCNTTAVALIALAMMDAGADLADINLADIAADPNFDDVLSNVTSIIEAGGDPTESAVIQQAVEDFLSPPAPPPTPTYTVTYDKNDTEASGTMAAQTIASGSSANLTACTFTKIGWTFAGWATTSGGAVEYADEASYTMGSANVTLYAQWTINTYTVTYDGNDSTGGTVPFDANNYEQGDSVTVLGNTGNLVKTQDGISLLFTGWNTAANGSGTSYNAADTFNMGNANVTLFSQWSVIRGTGPAGGLIFYDKSSVSDGWRYLEAAPSSTEMSGIEWGSYGTLIGGTETGIGTGKSNTTIIATWLNSNSETGKAAQVCDVLNEGSYSDWFLPSLGELNLMYTNLHIEGVGGFTSVYYWGSSEGGDNTAWAQFFDSGFQGKYLKNDHNRLVRAARAFRSTAPTYIVSYNANGADGGTVPSDGCHYEPGDTVTVLDKGTLAKTNYTFGGWNTAADGTGTDQAPGFTFNMSSENVTLYAQWTINTYTVSFNSQGGSSVVSQTVDHGGKATEPTAPTKTGHTFGGWYKEPGCTNVWDFTTDTVIADVTLYAKWTINSYTVTYNGNCNTGGTVPAGPTSYEYGATVTVLGNTGNLVKDGYIFSDWNTWSNGNGTDRAVGSTFVLGASNVTLYAKWTTYSLRDEGPAGGLIFYINPNYLTDGWRYLEAAPSPTEWSGIQWGSWAEEITGTETGIGTGQDNTGIIVNWLDNHLQTGKAAQLCFDLSIVNNSETYDDWFLPSKDELNQIYVYLHGWAVGDFLPVYYWSSSEENALHACCQYFLTGGQPPSTKYSELQVRAIRAF